MGSRHYQPEPCAAEGCANNALTGSPECWDHVADRQAFLDTLPKRLVGAWLVDVDFSGRDLRGINLSDARMSGARLAGANLAGADLRRTFLDGADLRGADLTGADLEMAVLGGADVSEATFADANLQRANLVGAKGHRTTFARANLYYSRPGNADFREADFTGATIQRAIFRRANLALARLQGTHGEANFENANLQDVLGSFLEFLRALSDDQQIRQKIQNTQLSLSSDESPKGRIHKLLSYMSRCLPIEGTEPDEQVLRGVIANVVSADATLVPLLEEMAEDPPLKQIEQLMLHLHKVFDQL